MPSTIAERQNEADSLDNCLQPSASSIQKQKDSD